MGNKSNFGTPGYDVSVAGCAFYLFSMLFSQKCKFSVVSVYWCCGVVWPLWVGFWVIITKLSRGVKREIVVKVCGCWGPLQCANLMYYGFLELSKSWKIDITKARLLLSELPLWSFWVFVFWAVHKASFGRPTCKTPKIEKTVELRNGISIFISGRGRTYQHMLSQLAVQKSCFFSRQRQQSQTSWLYCKVHSKPPQSLQTCR